MAKLIKKSEVKSPVKKLSEIYNVGETVKWCNVLFDGRGYNRNKHEGNIIKINRSTVDVMIENGDIYRVHMDELK